MARMLFYRLLLVPPVVAGVTVATFILILMIPGNPADVFLPDGTTAEARAAYIERNNLDGALLPRFWAWVTHAIQGDLGISLGRGRPAVDVVLEALGNTLVLAAAALVIALVVGLSMGTVLAVLHDRRRRLPRLVGSFTNFFAIALQSLPQFWLGLVLLYFFAVHWQILPVGGIKPVTGEDSLWIRVQHLLMPAVVASIFATGIIARNTRALLLDVINQDFVLLLRSRGYSSARILRHVMRNILGGELTIVGLQAGHLVLGTLFAESVFSWPGIGSAMAEAIATRDYPVIQASILLTGLLFTLITLVVDMGLRLVDPRVRSI